MNPRSLSFTLQPKSLSFMCSPSLNSHRSYYTTFPNIISFPTTPKRSPLLRTCHVSRSNGQSQPSPQQNLSGLWTKLTTLCSLKLDLPWSRTLFYPCFPPASLVSHSQISWVNRLSMFFKKRLYLFIFRERGREGEKRQCTRETLIRCLSHTPSWGSGLQPRHVP